MLLFKYIVIYFYWMGSFGSFVAGNFFGLPKFPLLLMPCPVELLCPGALGAVHFGAKCAKGRALLQCPHASIHAPQSSAGQHLETICTLDVFDF